jgi:hypothetical protein
MNNSFWFFDMPPFLQLEAFAIPFTGNMSPFQSLLGNTAWVQFLKARLKRSWFMHIIPAT